MCVVTCRGRSQHTRTHERCLSCIFDESLYFELKGMDPTEVEQGKVNIAVYDANKIRRNVLIGECVFDDW